MNDLNDRLAAAAEEMTGTNYEDLRHRVHTTSRRLGYRRAAVGSLAVLVVLAVGVATGVRLLPRSHALPGPAGTGTPTPTPTPTATVAPTPSGTGAAPSQGAPAVPAGAIPGTLTYLSRDGGPLTVVTVTNGGAPKTRTFGQVPADQHVFSVSPDGTRIAMILSPDPGSLKPGDLVVVEPGGTRHKLATGIGWGGGTWPYWTPDGKQLVANKDGHWLYVDAASGRTSPGPQIDYGEYLAWSPGGTYRAYTRSGQVVVARPDWTEVRHIAPKGLAGCPAPQDIGCSSVQAVSEDGRYVALGVTNTDPSHVTRSVLIVDTTTGKAAPLPAKVTGGLSKVFFRPDGGMLVETVTTGGGYALYAVTPDGTVSVTVPETQRPGDLVGYRT
jgi:hypothetical protein